MFLGQFEHTIDEKGRLIIPARYRELLASSAYITRGFDRNLIVLTGPHFQRIYQNVNSMSLTDSAARDLRRLIFSNAVAVEFDKAGRILIPQFLRDAAGLTGATLLIGMGEYFEVWSAENWQKQDLLLQDDETNAQRFSALDL
jgi:MraZ protein